MKKILTKEQLDRLKIINDLATKEGWSIFWSIGDTEEWRIERHDDEAIFKGDFEAMVHVINLAIKGSSVHKEAIGFIIEHGTNDEIKYILKSVTLCKTNG
ncbi:MAG: hypothetical protein KBA90_14375 [Chitinophagaceae bacterium]|nr:hypothetical protein [Chitinophagaceae bacterium]